MKEYDTVYKILHAIYDKYRRRYRGNPDSKQVCCMRSLNRPPDVLCETPQIYEMEKKLGIYIEEDEALMLYDMELDEAARAIVEMKKEQSEPNSFTRNQEPVNNRDVLGYLLPHN